MQRLLVLALLALTARGLLADDEKFPLMQVGGVTYTNVTVLSHNATEIYFRHDGGLGNARLSYLPKEIRTIYGYDPIAAKLLDKQRAEQQTGYQQIAFNYASARARAMDEISVYSEQAEKAAKAAELSEPCSPASPLGKPAPLISVDRWLGDAPPPTDGKFTVVFFYRSDSEPCRRAVPDLNQLAKRFPSKLVVIGINMDGSTSKSDSKAPELNFPCGADANGFLARQLEISSLPAVMVADQRKMVRYVGHPSALGDEAFTKLLGD